MTVACKNCEMLLKSLKRSFMTKDGNATVEVGVCWYAGNGRRKRAVVSLVILLIDCGLVLVGISLPASRSNAGTSSLKAVKLLVALLKPLTGKVPLNQNLVRTQSTG